MNLNWEEIVNGDDHLTPRQCLEEFLTIADELTELVLIGVRRGDTEDQWDVATAGSSIKCEGMLAMAHREIQRHNDQDAE